MKFYLSEWRNESAETRPEAKLKAIADLPRSSVTGGESASSLSEASLARDPGEDGGQVLDGVTARGWTGWLGRDQEIPSGIEQPVVHPDTRHEEDQTVKGAVAGQERGDSPKVLREP